MIVSRKLVFEFDADDKENFQNVMDTLQGIVKNYPDAEETKYIQETWHRLNAIRYNNIPSKEFGGD